MHGLILHMYSELEYGVAIHIYVATLHACSHLYSYTAIVYGRLIK